MLRTSCILILFVVKGIKSQTIEIDGKEWPPWLILALALAFAVVLLCLTCFFALYICKKFVTRFEKENRKHDAIFEERPKIVLPYIGETEMNDNEEVLQFDQTSLGGNSPQEISKDKIKILQSLGIGEFGPIYDSEVQLNINLKARSLIKVFQKGTAQDLVHFRKELESLMKLNHAKVGKMLGVVSQRPYFCLLELPVNGDLKTFLITTKTTDIDITLEQLIGMGTDVASGIQYLQSMNYIHKDIAARNCMVTQRLGVKVTDYKVGRYLFRGEYAVQADGALLPIRWMAPETLLENRFSLQSDIWSFGVLLWEILTKGEYPYCELSDGEVIKGVCYDFQRLLQPVDCTEEIYQLMLVCWHSNPEQRPKMEHLHHHLESYIFKKNYNS